MQDDFFVMRFSNSPAEQLELLAAPDGYGCGFSPKGSTLRSPIIKARQAPKNWNLGLNHPDYSYLTGSIDTVAITVTKTRYGDYFLGIKSSVSTAPMSLNINTGSVDPYHDLMASQEKVNTFLSGWAINVSTGFFEGISVTYSPTVGSQVHDIVYEHGVAFPLVVGVSLVHNWKINR